MTRHRGDAATSSPAIMRVNPVLAALLGLNESIVLLQLEYLVGISTTEERDGKQWTYQQWKGGFDQMFPWMAEKTLRRAIAFLKEKGLVETSRGRVNWYTVNHDEIAKLTGQNVLLNESEKGQNVPGQQDKMSPDGDTKGQNVFSEKDKMSSEKRTKCPLPIHTEISTKTSPKKDEDPDADAPSPVAFEPIRLNAEQRRDLATSDAVARYFELFACPTFPNARGRIAGDIGKVAGRYKPEVLIKFFSAVGQQHPKAKPQRQYLTSRPETLGPEVAAFVAAGCPDVLPARIELSSIGGTFDRPTDRVYQVGGDGSGRNKYVEDEEVEAAFTESARRQQRQVPA